jgi:hypothetical protein
LLYGTNHDVFAALMPPAAFVKHLEGLANPGGVTKEHLESAAAL